LPRNKLQIRKRNFERQVARRIRVDLESWNCPAYPSRSVKAMSQVSAFSAMCFAERGCDFVPLSEDLAERQTWSNRGGNLVQGELKFTPAAQKQQPRFRIAQPLYRSAAAPRLLPTQRKQFKNNRPIFRFSQAQEIQSKSPENRCLS